MAKYTETFEEYLEQGGLLPSDQFALIDGFEDIFKERYCGNEIGFETEMLFAMKLDMRAKIVMPVYKNKLEIVSLALTGLKQPSKCRYETRAYGLVESTNESNSENVDLPFNVETAKPASTAHVKGDASTKAHTDYVEFKNDISIDEQLRIVNELNREARLIIEDCLKEFKPLFMGVY